MLCGSKPKDFRVGTKVTLSWHPNRNGLPGGELTEVKLEDGRTLKGGFRGSPRPAHLALRRRAALLPAPRRRREQLLRALHRRRERRPDHDCAQVLRQRSFENNR
jgi:hypothetical protein